MLAYYAMAFAISWGAILVIVGPGGFLGTTSTSPSFALVGFTSLLGPSVAGVLMTALVDGRSGLTRASSRGSADGASAVRWYAVALLTAPLVTTTTLLALSLTSPAFLPAIITADDKASLVLSGIAVGLIVPVFEELGWTGFVTPRLRQRHGVLGTGLIVGLLWGAWHLPLFAGSAASSGAIPPALFMAAMLFCVAAALPGADGVGLRPHPEPAGGDAHARADRREPVRPQPRGDLGGAAVPVPHRHGRGAVARRRGGGSGERRTSHAIGGQRRRLRPTRYHGQATGCQSPRLAAGQPPKVNHTDPSAGQATVA